MASKGFGFTSLTGGGAGALDAIDGSALAAGYMAFGSDASNKISYTYVCAASSAAADGTTVIIPLTNPGTLRWHLLKMTTKDGIIIYDGTNTGRLQFSSNELELYNERHSGVVKIMVEDAGGNKETAAKFTGAAGAELYYDNSKKFETTTSGTTTTGTPVSSAAPVDNGATGYPYAYRKNIVINGDTGIFQRGYNFTGVSSTTFPCDRFFYGQSNDGTMNVYGGSSSVPTLAQAGTVFPYSLYLDVATADASLAAGQYGVLSYIVEGYDIGPHRGKIMTLSFWVRSNKVGTYGFSFGNAGADLCYVTTYDVNVLDAWEKKTITFTMTDGSSGTWDWVNGRGLRLRWGMCAGTTFQTATTGSWIAGNYLGTAACVNFMDNASNEFRLTGVQLEVGSVATAFEPINRNTELLRCQRYYEKSFDYLTAPAQNAGYGNGSSGVIQLVGAGSPQYGPHIAFRVMKRATPATITFYNTDANNSQARNISVGADCSNTTTWALSESGFTVSLTTAAGSAVGNANAVHWVADAEM